MTLFGQTFDGQQVASLVFMILALVLWVSAWRGDRRQTRWLRDWNAARRARREAAERNDRDRSDVSPPSDSRGPEDFRGPWG